MEYYGEILEFCMAYRPLNVSDVYNLLGSTSMCMATVSLGCQPLHKRGRVWYHRYTHVADVWNVDMHDRSDHSVVIRVHFPRRTRKFHLTRALVILSTNQSGDRGASLFLPIAQILGHDCWYQKRRDIALLSFLCSL